MPPSIRSIRKVRLSCLLFFQRQIEHNRNPGRDGDAVSDAVFRVGIFGLFLRILIEILRQFDAHFQKFSRQLLTFGVAGGRSVSNGRSQDGDRFAKQAQQFRAVAFPDWRGKNKYSADFCFPGWPR